MVNFFVGIINFFKSKFRLLLFGFVLTIALIAVQYIGSYTSFLWKYGIALGATLPLFFIWNWLESKFSKQVASVHERSVIWIVLFLLIIPIGILHTLQKEWNYQYHFPMCDCEATDNRDDRVGAICKDGFKSYATGRGTCSEHDGVRKWQCKCD